MEAAEKFLTGDCLRNIKNHFFLAGGLNKDNIETAVKKINPCCVDLSSGIETEGVKDLNKIIEIIKIVRGIK
jgi:phosphoribosylanthranilate isomerase